MCVDKTSKLPIMFSLEPVNIDDSAYVVTVVDISKRKNAEKQLQTLNNQLESLVDERTRELESVQQELVRQEKMIVLGRMAGAIVHELSQPVVALKSAMASLSVKRQRNDIDGIGDSISNMAPLCEHMQDVIVQLRAFGYQGQTNKCNVKIVEPINKILRTYSDECVHWSEKIFASMDASVYCNETMLELVVDNLIRNAVEAVEESDSPRVDISLEKTDTHCLVHIEDNGGKNDSGNSQAFV